MPEQGPRMMWGSVSWPGPAMWQRVLRIQCVSEDLAHVPLAACWERNHTRHVLLHLLGMNKEEKDAVWPCLASLQTCRASPQGHCTEALLGWLVFQGRLQSWHDLCVDLFYQESTPKYFCHCGDVSSFWCHPNIQFGWLPPCHPCGSSMAHVEGAVRVQLPLLSFLTLDTILSKMSGVGWPQLTAKVPPWCSTCFPPSREKEKGKIFSQGGK